MATTYFQDNAASDINKNSATLVAPTASKKLLQTAAGAGTSVAITLPASGTNLQHCFVSEPSDPSTTGGSGARTWTVNLNVTTANANLSGPASAGAQCTITRINSAGTNQTTVGASSGPGSTWPQSTGTKTWTFTSVDAGTFASGDRFYVALVFTNGNTMTSQSVTIQVGLANGTEEVSAPWTFTVISTGTLKQPRVLDQALSRAALWMKRHSGIVVPRLWTPAGA